MELVADLGTHRSNSGKKLRQGIFLCPFCKSKVIRWSGDGMRNKSCGCARTPGTHRMTASGKDNKALFWVFHGIKSRCFNPNHCHYDRYGKRGISVCKEWLDNSSLFFDWAIKNGWQKGLTVDRIDNDGPYSPQNCQIITLAENTRKRSTSKLDHDDVAEIRKLNSVYGVTPTEISVLFGITDATAGKVIRCEIWF